MQGPLVVGGATPPPDQKVCAPNYCQGQTLPLHLCLIAVSVPELKSYAGPAGPTGIHSTLIKHTGFLLARMGHVAAKQFSERIAQLGLTMRMWGALNVLDAEGETTQQFLGKSTGIDPSSMVATIDDLEARGLVERRP